MAGAGGYGALFLPPPVCPEKNLVAQNYAANTLHARTRESSRGRKSRPQVSAVIYLRARELAGCFQNGNTNKSTYARAREAPRELKNEFSELLPAPYTRA